MRRRNFIYTTLSGISGIALAGLSISSCSGLSNQTVLALIGCGHRGSQLLEYLSGITSEVKIKYVCDVDTARGDVAVNLVKNRFGYIPEFRQNMKDVFADKEVDLVLIATPVHWNVLASVLACQAGKDIYLETLPSLTIEEGQKLKRVAQKYKSGVQIGFHHRSADYCISARNYISSGKLGQVVHVKTYNLKGGSKIQSFADTPVPEGLDWDAWLGPAPYRPYNSGIIRSDDCAGWNSFWDYSGGHLGYEACHVLDMARMVLNDPGSPKAVYCYGGNRASETNREVPEYQIVTYNYDSFTLTCESSSVMPYMIQPTKNEQSTPDALEWQHKASRIEIYGTNGLMYLGVDGNGWQVIAADGKITAEERGIKPDQAHLQNFIENHNKHKLLNAPVVQGYLSALLVHMGNIAFRTGNSYLIFDAEREEFVENEQANFMIKKSYREGYHIPDGI